MGKVMTNLNGVSAKALHAVLKAGKQKIAPYGR